MSKYEAVYFVGDNEAINRVRVDSYKTRNRGAFSGSLAALLETCSKIEVQLRHLKFRLPKLYRNNKAETIIRTSRLVGYQSTSRRQCYEVG